jgi:effector-binding domain-containing protein
VRKRGGAASDEDEAEADEEEAEAEAGAADTTADAKPAPQRGVDLPPATEALGDVKVAGTPVEYVRLEPRRAAGGSYTGYMAELDSVRNAIRAWAMTQGYEVAGRPYEEWENGVNDAFTADGEFDVFWEIKE